MLRQARDAREMAIDFPCFIKKKKHKNYRKNICLLKFFYYAKYINREKFFIQIP